MEQKMSEEEKFLIGGALVALGTYILYYLTTGHGRENNAALIPDTLEDKIDRVVEVLNAQVGKNWAAWGAETLKTYLRNTLPRPLVTLVDVVHAVEQEARRGRIPRYAKRQYAIAIATT